MNNKPKKRILKIRKAKKQVDQAPDKELQRDDEGLDYNIWYHKFIGQKQDPFETAVKSKTRCHVSKDSGWTKGCEKELPFFCVYFARGCCCKGDKCNFLHRIPTVQDEVRVPLTKDCFGRDKHAFDREDMGGIGTFKREGKTIYIKGLKNLQGVDLTGIVIKHFKEWGEIAFVKVQAERCIARVKYKNRLNAEFAKEAMTYQSLDNDEILLVTWAGDDDSQMEKTRVVMENRRRLVKAVKGKGSSTQNFQTNTVNNSSQHIGRVRNMINKVQKEKESKQNISNSQLPQPGSQVNMQNNPLYQQLYAQYYNKYFPEYWNQHQNKVESVKAKKQQKNEINNINNRKQSDNPQELTYQNYLHQEYRKNVLLQRERKNENEGVEKKRKLLDSSVVDLYPSQFQPSKKKQKFS